MSLIQFIQYHKPGISSGDYRVDISQEIKSKKITCNNQYSDRREFTVQGPRFSLSADDIRSMYPPNQSQGIHRATLPHITFNRSTLPWEREIWKEGSSGDVKTVTWLALLTVLQSEIDRGDIEASIVISAEELSKDPHLNINLESTQLPDDKVTVVGIRRSLVEHIVPTAQELSCLAHIRNPKGTHDNEIRSTLVGNRLAADDDTAFIYLVSMENRYNNDGTFFISDKIQPTDTVRFVCLKQWEYTSQHESHDFGALLKALKGPITLKLPTTPKNRPQAKKIDQSFVPMAHTTRQGQSTVSWYRSPLIAGDHTSKINQTTVRSADQLLRFDTTTNMLDTTYAAAWQLGQIMALNDMQFSERLFQWKRQNMHQIQQEIQFDEASHLFVQTRAKDRVGSLPYTEFIQSWFKELALLNNVPFQYLVPYEDMLPVESIRFFQVDPIWIECLLDGAFSMGRVIKTDAENDQEQSICHHPFPNMSGFLLRSFVVRGWPDLIIEGKDSAGNALNIIRKVNLSEDLLMVLFDQEIKEVSIRTKPETLHFGFKDDGKKLTKELKGSDGKEIKEKQGAKQVNKVISLEDDNYWKSRENRVIDILKICDASDISPFDSAHFALQMMEGSDKIVFSILG